MKLPLCPNIILQRHTQAMEANFHAFLTLVLDGYMLQLHYVETADIIYCKEAWWAPLLVWK